MGVLTSHTSSLVTQEGVSVEYILCGLIFLKLGARLVGLVVKASASRAEDPGFESRLWRDFSGVESYQ